MLGRKTRALQRRAVVAELGVVVVLDDEAAGAAQRRARRGAQGEHDAGRALVGGGGEHDRRVERVDIEAVRIDGHAGERPCPRREHRAMRRKARVLHGDRARAATGERPPQQRQPLGGARAHHHRVRIGHHAAHASQVSGELAAQLGRATPVRVGERARGGRAQHVAQRPRPQRARERGEVGRAGKEVELQRANALLRLGAVHASRAGRHIRAAALAGDEVALGEQLRVGVHHQPTGDLEIGGERARGRQAPAGGERAVAHELAQTILQLGATAPAA